MATETYLRRLPKWTSASGTIPPSSILKPPVTGIGPRDASANRVNDMGFVVADVKWQDIQPTATSGIVTTGTQLPLALGLRYADGSKVPIRLRVHSGKWAPQWVKDAVGSVTLITVERKPGAPAPGGDFWTTPRWWKQSLLDLWGDLMRQLAVLYDGNDQIREVTSNPATTQYAEPMQRGTQAIIATAGPNAGYTNVQVMFEAMKADGVSSADAQCELASGVVVGPSKVDANAVLWPTDRITVAGSTMSRWASFGWATTRYYLPYNPFQQWRVTNASTDPTVFKYTVQPDPGQWTTKVAVPQVAVNMRNRVMLGNNSLRAPIKAAGPTYPLLYETQALTASGNSFQTATKDIIGQQYALITPINETDAEAEAPGLAATLSAGFGLLTTANDPLGIVNLPPGSTLDRFRARSIELPPAWATLLTPAQCATYNAAAQSNPTGD